MANVVGGIAIGVLIGLLLVEALTRVGEDPVLAIVITLAAGYAAYVPAERVGVSGVLAAVAAGLVVRRRLPLISSAAGRLIGDGFWEVLVFLLNAVLFVLVGLQFPDVLQAQTRSGWKLAELAALVSAGAIGMRLVWLNTVPHFPGVVDERLIGPAGRAGWRQRTVIAWSGLRGAVSLAAALALPAAVPERPLLIFLTISVIFATLVGQGLSLPWLIRRLGVKDDGVAAGESLQASRAAVEAALEQLDHLEQQDWTRPETIERMQGMYRVRRADFCNARASSNQIQTATTTSKPAHATTNASSAKCSTPNGSESWLCATTGP